MITNQLVVFLKSAMSERTKQIKLDASSKGSKAKLYIVDNPPDIYVCTIREKKITCAIRKTVIDIISITSPLGLVRRRGRRLRYPPFAAKSGKMAERQVS